MPLLHSLIHRPLSLFISLYIIFFSPPGIVPKPPLSYLTLQFPIHRYFRTYKAEHNKEFTPASAQHPLVFLFAAKLCGGITTNTWELHVFDRDMSWFSFWPQCKQGSCSQRATAAYQR